MYLAQYLANVGAWCLINVSYCCCCCYQQYLPRVQNSLTSMLRAVAEAADETRSLLSPDVANKNMGCDTWDISYTKKAFVDSLKFTPTWASCTLLAARVEGHESSQQRWRRPYGIRGAFPLSHMVLIRGVAGDLRREGTVDAGQPERASQRKWGSQITQNGDFKGF